MAPRVIRPFGGAAMRAGLKFESKQIKFTSFAARHRRTEIRVKNRFTNAKNAPGETQRRKADPIVVAAIQSI
jgi:hypothetical protein